MKKRIVVYRNQYLDARRFWVQEMAKKEGLNPPFDSINSKDEKIEAILDSIAKQYYVNSSSIVSSLQKAKYVPSVQNIFPEDDARWISEPEASCSKLEEVRKEKARRLLEEGWPVNAVNEYLGLSFYALYRMSREIEKSFEYFEKGREGDVFELWQKGFSQTDIANQLGITRQTVNTDLKRIKEAYIAANNPEKPSWEELEKAHNSQCAKTKGEKKSNYNSKVTDAKEIIQKYIDANGNVKVTIAEIEKEAEVNSKTVQKFILVILLERNLVTRAVEFAIRNIGQTEIINSALNLFAIEKSENKKKKRKNKEDIENESYRAVYYLSNNSERFAKIKNPRNTKFVVEEALKELSEKKII